MRILLYLLLATLTACGTTNNAGVRLPSHVDPNACYVRYSTPAVYDTTVTRYLSYSEEEAVRYPHLVKKIITREEFSRWETTTIEDCVPVESDDCQALCLRTHPAEVVTYYEPTDTSLGTPEWGEAVSVKKVSNGGAVGYEKVDCELTEYQSLGVHFPFGSANLTEEDLQQIDDQIYKFLSERPNLSVMIAVHAAPSTTRADCLLLAKRRAQAIANYLVSEGVHRGRLIMRPECRPNLGADNERVLFRVPTGGDL